MTSKPLLFALGAALLSSQAGRAQSYPGPLLTMPVTTESIAKATELDAYALGVSAYLWGYPPPTLVRLGGGQ